MEQIFKLDHPLEISIKMLDLAGKLLQEHDNFKQVPAWLVETLKVGGAALGIITAKQCIVNFAGVDQNSGDNSMEFDLDALWCSRQNSSGNRNIPCCIFDCQVGKMAMERCGRPDLEATCFPMAGRKGFLMVAERRCC
jgi:hypothetical protein